MADNVILAEHIDVLLLGPDAHKLLSRLQHDCEVEAKAPPQKPYNRYLQSLLGLASPPAPPVLQHPHCLQLCNMTKLTVSVLSKSLWLTINFHYPNSQFYDPFVSEFVKGGCSIAILVGCAQLAKVMETGLGVRYDNKEIQSTNKNEGFYQSRILAKALMPSLAGIETLLNLSILQDSTIQEQTSNLPRSTNQILRWIVEKHFQNAHRVKISPVMGDQIQFNHQKKQERTCSLF